MLRSVYGTRSLWDGYVKSRRACVQSVPRVVGRAVLGLVQLHDARMDEQGKRTTWCRAAKGNVLSYLRDRSYEPHRTLGCLGVSIRPLALPLVAAALVRAFVVIRSSFRVSQVFQ